MLCVLFFPRRLDGGCDVAFGGLISWCAVTVASQGVKVLTCLVLEEGFRFLVSGILVCYFALSFLHGTQAVIAELLFSFDRALGSLYGFDSSSLWLALGR